MPKVLIDIPEEIYSEIKKYDGKHDVFINRAILYEAVCNGIILDGLTNGEVLMKMFPKWEVNTGYRDEWYQKAVKVDINPKNDFEDNKMITLDWWNAKWGE